MTTTTSSSTIFLTCTITLISLFILKKHYFGVKKEQKKEIENKKQSTVVDPDLIAQGKPSMFVPFKNQFKPINPEDVSLEQATEHFYENSRSPSTISISSSIRHDTTRSKVGVALKAVKVLFQHNLVNSTQRGQLKTLILDNDERILQMIEVLDDDRDMVGFLKSLLSLVKN